MAEVDVVALVDWREGRRDDDSDSRPALTLSCSLPTRPGALAMPGDDGLEATVQQCTRFEHSPSLIHQPRVSILGDDSRLVVEADPSRSHDIGVDVVKQIIDPEVFHMQIETFVELLANQPEILG